jgi:hypothetical protein
MTLAAIGLVSPRMSTPLLQCDHLLPTLEKTGQIYSQSI